MKGRNARTRVAVWPSYEAMDSAVFLAHCNHPRGDIWAHSLRLWFTACRLLFKRLSLAASVTYSLSSFSAIGKSCPPFCFGVSSASLISLNVSIEWCREGSKAEIPTVSADAPERRLTSNTGHFTHDLHIASENRGRRF